MNDADTIEEDVKQNTETKTESKTDDPLYDLDKDFEQFQSSKSEHEIEKQPEAQTNQDEFIPTEINMVESFKLQMFLGLFFLMLDGMHVFMYRFISKLDIKKDDIALDESDQESLAVYFQTPRVLALINKLPSELIGLVHIEYLYWQKFEEVKKTLKKIETKTDEQTNTKKETQNKKSSESKAPPRKKAKRRSKKPAAKKTATKKVSELI